MDVHDHDGPARGRAEDGGVQGPLGRLLDARVQRQDNIVPRLSHAPYVLRLAVADIVHQHGFGPGGAAQLFIVAGFDAEHPAIVGQAIEEEGLFSLEGTVIALQIAQQVPGRGAGKDRRGWTASRGRRP